MKPERIVRLRNLCSNATPSSERDWPEVDADISSEGWGDCPLVDSPWEYVLAKQIERLRKEIRTALPESLDYIQELEARVRELEVLTASVENVPKDVRGKE